MQLVKVFEKLVCEDCLGTDMVALIKTAIKLILRLHKANYPVTLLPDVIELVIENKGMGWVCEG